MSIKLLLHCLLLTQLPLIAMQVTPNELNKYRIPKIKDYYLNECLESDDDNDQTYSMNNSKPNYTIPIDPRLEPLQQQIAAGEVLSYRVGLFAEDDQIREFAERPYLITRRFAYLNDAGFRDCYVTIAKKDLYKLEDDVLVRTFKQLPKLEKSYVYFRRPLYENQTNLTNNSVLSIVAQKTALDPQKEHLKQQIASGKVLAYRIGLLLRVADESNVCTKFAQRPYLITRQFIMEQTDNGFMPCYVTVSKEDEDKLEDDCLVRSFKKLDKVDTFHLHFPRQ